MKTPLQELLRYESDLTIMFDSDVRVAGALLEYIRNNKKDMLIKEYTVIKDAYDAGLFDGSMDDVDDRLYKDYYNETFNTKQK